MDGETPLEKFRKVRVGKAPDGYFDKSLEDPCEFPCCCCNMNIPWPQCCEKTRRSYDEAQEQ